LALFPCEFDVMYMEEKRQFEKSKSCALVNHF